MIKKDISPEERLLSLIKSKEKKPVAKPALEPPKSAPQSGIAHKADERISGVLKSEIFKNKIFEPAAIKNINKYLIIVLGVLLLYMMVDFIFVRPYKNVQAIIAKAKLEEGAKGTSPVPRNVTAMKDYSSYSAAGPGKVVFGQDGAGAVSEEVTTSGGMSDNIGLVGIITGANPQAIIEDKKAQKTYYLNKGQTFDGYVVEDIQEGKVILNYEGKRVSLFL